MPLRQSCSWKNYPGQCIPRSFDHLQVNLRHDFLFCAPCNSQCATEKDVNMSYENNLIIGKSHVQGWIYFILVSKLQWEPGNYLYAVYDRNIVQIKQRGLFVGKGIIIYWKQKLPICLLARDKMNVGVVLNCSQFPEILSRGGIAMHIQF